jgi:ABC-2 type transport system permease protein
MTQLKASGDLLKKVQFPGWAPVLGASIVQLVQVALEIVVLMGLFVWQRNIGWTWLLAIPILIGTAFFAQGIGLMLAILNARFGDVQYIVAVILGAFYFLTPILYPISMVQEQNVLLSTVVQANPMSWFVQSMHDVMYSLTAPTWWVIPSLLIGGFITFWIGFVVFNRASEDLGEYL